MPMLKGIKVVDLTTVVFGPYCTQILADLGAEVIKVETPGGDVLRWAAKSAKTKGMAPIFFGFNHGKRSIALDLKAPEDNAVIKGLLADADVFVANVRGKALERLELDYEAVKAIRPDIIFVHCVGFGQDGPYADLQAYDDVIQAAGGVASLLPLVDGNPAPRFMPSLIADKVSGLHAAYATMAALFHRQRTGDGQKVEVPMLESFASFMMNEHLGGLTFDPPVGPAGYARQLDPERQPFRTADGYIVIVAYTYESWERIFDLLGEPDYIKDPRFEGPAKRAAAMPELYRHMAELTPNFTTAHLLERCHAEQIPAQPVNDIASVLADEHLNAVGLFKKREHPTEGTYHEIGQPVRFGAMPKGERRAPPQLDQDGPAIRADLARKAD